ncbi:MAG: asparagine synthase-related protein [Thermoplasmata archaeon]
MGRKEIAGRLASSLDESVRGRTASIDNVAIAFSGGLDSSLIACLASRYTKPVLYVVGEENSSDLIGARMSAHILELPLKEIILSDSEVEGALPSIVDVLESTHSVLVSYKIPQFFVTMSAQEDVILIGNGADELFGGYSKYERLDPGMMMEAMQSDLEKLLKIEIPMDNRMGHKFGKTFEYPFLSADVIEVAMEAPTDLKVGEEGHKMILRDAAKKFGLPTEISDRKKKAAQYGTGATKILRRIAKSRGLSVSKYIENLGDF